MSLSISRQEPRTREWTLEEVDPEETMVLVGPRDASYNNIWLLLEFKDSYAKVVHLATGSVATLGSMDQKNWVVLREVVTLKNEEVKVFPHE